MPYFDTPCPESRVYARVEELNKEVENLEAELATMKAKAEAIDRLEEWIRTGGWVDVMQSKPSGFYCKVGHATRSTRRGDGPSLVEAINALPSDEPVKTLHEQAEDDAWEFEQKIRSDPGGE